MTEQAIKEKEEEPFCPCPDTYPDWDGTSVSLSGLCVHEMKIASIFHMPVAYDMYVERQDENVHHLELKQRWPGLVLTKTGMFSGKIIRIIEDAQSPSRLVHFIAGDFTVMAEMHEGGIGTVPKAAHKMQIAMVEKGCMPKELYLAHLTCEVCRDKKGGDKVLMLRRYTANQRVQQNLEKENEKAAKKAAKITQKEARETVVEKLKGVNEAAGELNALNALNDIKTDEAINAEVAVKSTSESQKIEKENA